MKDDIEYDDTTMEEREAPKVVTRDGVQSARRDRRAEPPATQEPTGQTTEERPARLFEGDRASELKSRWTDVQAQFVDDPREAVKSADALVDEVIRDLSTLFSDERSGLESHWTRNEEVSTEDLRQALRRYRSFFERLLSI
jgi:hypothetical protein